MYVTGRSICAGKLTARRCVKQMMDTLPFTLFVLFCFCGTVSKGVFASWSCLEVRHRPPN